MPSSILVEAPSTGGRSRPRLSRALWLGLGLLSLTIGLVGVVVPLLPTTGPLILAAACFARSSPRLETWLLDHPRFGPLLRDWRNHGAVPRRAKFAACLGMMLGFGLFLLMIRPGLPVAGLVAVVMGLCAAWLVSRPAPSARGTSNGV